MKNFIAVLILLFAVNAKAQQELNKKIEDPNKHKEVMINKCTRAALTSFPEFKESYDLNYNYYKVDSAALKELGEALKGTKITIVLGTWCDDSKFQVPRFLKIIDQLNLPTEKLTFIAVDGLKKAENGLIDNMNIEHVPTFIFSNKKGEEIGRIVESPKETLEKDILKLTAKNK